MDSTEGKPTIVNSHTHLATTRNLPWFLFTWPIPIPLILLVGFRYTRWLLLIPLRILGWLAARLSWDILESRWGRLLSLAKMSDISQGSQTKVYEHLQKYYPEKTKFVVLSLDTEFMHKGERGKPTRWISQRYESQLKELIEIKRANPDTIYPFLAIDPRRGWGPRKVEAYIKQGFHGVKLYPPHGYKPYDASYRQLYPELLHIYAYLQEKGIPITAHCTPGGLKGKPFKDDHKNFSDPDNYRDLLLHYPKLKLCLAHFGGNSEWQNYLNTPWEVGQPKAWVSKIIDMIKYVDESDVPLFPNLYVDISYTTFDPQTLTYLKVLLTSDENKILRERTLFGSDYPIIQVDLTERAFSIELRGYLGEEVFDRIARKNPRNFLGI